MRFALLGDHPDGVDLASALVDCRHSLVATTAHLAPAVLARLGEPARISDLEEILADEAIEAVIVAGSQDVRAGLLRRAVQSERHVACVHPADAKPDVAYEAAMMQQDTGYLLFPLLPEALHPGIIRLAEFISPGSFRLLTFERHASGEVLESILDETLEPSFPGWDILRRLGGEVAEVSSFADGEEPVAGLPVLLAGRFTAGGLFQMTLVPGQPAAWWRLTVIGTRGQMTLTWPQGWNGPAFLNWREPLADSVRAATVTERGETPLPDGRGSDGETGYQEREEYFPRFDPWPKVVEIFERSVAESPGEMRWQDEVRALELDDAARRSVERRRVGLMEYQDASEEVGFKGTMTLVGCAMLWGVIGLLIASRWVSWLGWLVLPLLVVFIGLQLLRYVIPKQGQKVEEGIKR